MTGFFYRSQIYLFKMKLIPTRSRFDYMQYNPVRSAGYQLIADINYKKMDFVLLRLGSSLNIVPT